MSAIEMELCAHDMELSAYEMEVSAQEMEPNAHEMELGANEMEACVAPTMLYCAHCLSLPHLTASPQPDCLSSCASPPHASPNPTLLQSSDSIRPIRI